MSKTVIEMVVQCGFWREHIDTWLCSTKDFERFAELVRADERAKLAEQPAQPASEADMQVYKAIADNYHASLQPAPVQQGHVGYVCFEGDEVIWTGDPPESNTLLYTAPQAQPAREPLTDDELADLWYKQSLDWMEFARAIEAKLREKNQ